MKKKIWGSKFSKKEPQKQKNEKMPKTINFEHALCIGVTKSVLPEFCRSCKVIFCSLFADEDGWEAEKSWNSKESSFFVSEMLFFTKSQTYLEENVPLIKH